jgi:hypothetical protein
MLPSLLSCGWRREDKPVALNKERNRRQVHLQAVPIPYSGHSFIVERTPVRGRQQRREFSEVVFEACWRNEFKGSCGSIARIPEGVRYPSRLADEIAWTCYQYFVSELKPNLSFQYKRILILVPMRVDWGSKRPRTDWMFNEGEIAAGVLCPDHEPYAELSEPNGDAICWRKDGLFVDTRLAHIVFLLRSSLNTTYIEYRYTTP